MIISKLETIVPDEIIVIIIKFVFDMIRLKLCNDQLQVITYYNYPSITGTGNISFPQKNGQKHLLH